MAEIKIGLTSDVHQRVGYLRGISDIIKFTRPDTLVDPGDNEDARGLEEAISDLLSEDMKLKSELFDKYDIKTEKDLEKISAEDQKKMQESEKGIYKNTINYIQKNHQRLKPEFDNLRKYTQVLGTDGNHDLKGTLESLGLKRTADIKGVKFRSVFNTHELPQIYQHLPRELLMPYLLGHNPDDEQLAGNPERLEHVLKGIEAQYEQAKDADVLIQHKIPKDEYDAPGYLNIDAVLRLGGHVHSSHTEIWKTKNDSGRYSYCVRAGSNEYVETIMDSNKNILRFDIYNVEGAEELHDDYSQMAA
ncbi:MAG: hypothetical protein ACLFPQ_00605 [Candidatus Woesearchaeota archaeon]